MRKVLLFCMCLLLVSCVAKGTYKDAIEVSESRKTQLEQASAEISALKKELSDLRAAKEAESATLNEKISELTSAKKDIEGLYGQKEKEASELKAKTEELSSTGLMTAREVEGLKEERLRLMAAEKAKTEEIITLRAELEEVRKELAEANERLSALSAEREAFLESGKAVKARLDDETGQREFLMREVERLKMKYGEVSEEKERELLKVKSTYEDLVHELKGEIEKGEIRITQAVDRLSVNMVEKILFDSGKAEIKPQGLKVLKRVGDILKGIPDKQIRVEGHTDNVRIGAKIREKYPTNWELSTARATNVVRYLQDKVGVDKKVLSAAGFSDSRPVAANETEEGKAQNRRIEIVLLPLDVDRVLEELRE